MPQWRKLHTKSVESLDIHDMPDDFHRLLWLMLPLVLDRCGRGMDSASWVKSKTMPMRNDVSNEMTGAALDWYAEHGMIERYEVSGRHYFWIPTWHNHQGDTGREADPLYPEPPGYFDPYVKEEGEGGEEDKGESPNDYAQEQGVSESGASQDQLTTKSGLDSDACSDANTDSDEDAKDDAPSARKKPKLTAGQRKFLDKFGAKRFRLNAQRDAVLAMEQGHGTTKLLEAATWAAKRGMNVGQAIVSLETALPKWGQPKGQKKHGTVEIASGLGERA